MQNCDFLTKTIDYCFKQEKHLKKTLFYFGLTLKVLKLRMYREYECHRELKRRKVIILLIAQITLRPSGK